MKSRLSDFLRFLSGSIAAIAWEYLSFGQGLVLDQSFQPLVTAPSQGLTGAILVEPNGKIVLAGGFEVIDGVQRSSPARLNPDGTPDLSFSAEVYRGIRTITRQQDGKVILAGFGGQ